MKVTEFSQPITSKKLNESMAKNFGVRLNLNNFTNEQLEDARNKLRTKLSQIEMSESYNAVFENSEYQKAKMFLDVINQEMSERIEAGTAIEEAQGKDTYFNKLRQQAMESVSEQWINSAKKRLSRGDYSKQDLVNELLVRYDLDESTATRVVRNVSILINETEEDKAALIMASKDMVDRITGWLEDVAAMKAEQLLELLDSIRDQLGSEKSEAFSQAVKPALENLYSTLESSRTTLSQGVGILTGQESGPAPSMGADPMGGSDMGMSGEEEFPTGDEFAASEPATGGDEAAGRAKRESIEYSRRLGMLLNSKKK
jgi:hypothetical protein